MLNMTKRRLNLYLDLNQSIPLEKGGKTIITIIDV